MVNVLIAAAVGVRGSHGIKECLAGLKRVSETTHGVDALLVDYSDDARYAAWLAKGQRIMDVKVMRQEFPEGTDPLERRARCLGIIRDYAIEHKYSHLLLISPDIVLPHDALKMLLETVGRKRMVAAGVTSNFYSIAGAVVKMSTLTGGYSEEQQEHLRSHKDELALHNPKLLAALEKANWDFSGVKHLLGLEETKGKGVLPIKGAPFECLLIPKQVVVDVPFKSDEDTPAEVLFFMEMKARKIPCVADTRVQCARQMPKAVMDDIKGAKPRAPARAA